MNKLFAKTLGPGLIYAAVAVGTSHVVQSTRAGATYGLTMVFLVVLVCMAKYPAFLFSSRYAAITGHTVVDGYAKRGKWLLYILLILAAIELTVATAASALVTSGILINVLSLEMDAIFLSMVLVFITIAILVVGKYKILESFCKVLVIGFCVTTLISTLLALLNYDISSIEPSSELVFDSSTTFFLVGVAGWMPTGIIGAIMLSTWVLARKNNNQEETFTRRDADIDFHVGYGASIFLAICFVLLGYIVISGQGDTIANDSVGFSVQVISLFTNTIGQWVYFLIAATIVAVMYSTLLALVDAFPRLITNIVVTLFPKETASIKENSFFLGLFILLFIFVWAVFYLLMSTFTEFIDFVTAMGFVITPIIAFFNHVIIFSDDIAPQERPGPVLRIWSASMIVVFTVIALIWLYFRIFG